MPNKALEADVRGLRLLSERRGKFFALAEIVSNAWDENGVTFVKVNTTHIPGIRFVRVEVEDDAPEGFQDLSHAYTLFAPSKKKSDPEKRGRFNLGEKLVIALADTFRVETTKGGIEIDVANNTRKHLRRKRDAGSRIIANIRMTRTELDDALSKFNTLIPPAGIVTEVNGVELPHRAPLATVRETLQTEIADAEGFLRPTRRATNIEIYAPRPGEVGTLYELGIPVVETGDHYHYNIKQKVPLNADRDNVPPAFLKDVRAIVLNTMATKLDSASASENWVNEALEDDLIKPEAVEEVLTHLYGERRVVFDPSDPEANRIALSKGYTVIPSNAFSRSVWNNIRAADAVRPSGQVTPSPKPFTPGGEPLAIIDPAKYTESQRLFALAVADLHKVLVGTPIHVELTKEFLWNFGGCYTRGYKVILNISKFKADIRDEEALATIIHEFAHHYGDHLTHKFDQGMGVMAARLVKHIMKNPDFLKQYVPQEVTV